MGWGAGAGGGRGRLEEVVAGLERVQGQLPPQVVRRRCDVEEGGEGDAAEEDERVGGAPEDEGRVASVHPDPPRAASVAGEARWRGSGLRCQVRRLQPRARLGVGVVRGTKR